MSGIWNRHRPSVYFCPSIGVSASPLIDRLGNAYCYLMSSWCVPTSIFSLHWYINQFIDQSIDRWILMSLIWIRHGPSVDLCPSIGVSASLLIDKSGNASWCLLSYWCAPPSVFSVRWQINLLIDQSIGEYWCLWFEIDTARPCHPSICVRR